MNLQKKTLLVLSWFPDNNNDDVTCLFVKDQVEILKRHFKKVIVIDPTPFLPSFFLRFVPEYLRKNLSKKDYKYDNVEVYFPRYLRIPKFMSKKKSFIDEQRFLVADKVIQDNKLEFDLIHAHFTFPGGYVGRRIKEKYKKPLVTTIHENYQWFREELDSKDREISKVWEDSDMLFSVNRKDVDELSFYNKNYRIFSNGYSSKRFRLIKDAKEILGLPKDKKLILSVGDLVKKKGHIHLIKAMEYVDPNAKCVIIGEGQLKKKLEKTIQELGLEKRICIENRKSIIELNLWMNACDLFVLPSLSESCGLVQIEAMSCGKPVVAAKNGGSEYILSPTTGILVGSADPSQLSDAIQKALSTEWDKEAILKDSKGLEIEVVLSDVLKDYESLLGGKP